MSATARWIACLALALASAGCSLLLEGPPANVCTSDAECSAGTCDAELGMCVVPTSGTLRLGIEVLPMASPTGGSPLLVSFPAFDLEGPAVRDLALPLPIGVPTSGLVSDLSSGEAVTASVVFTMESEFPGGQSARVEAQSRATATTDARSRLANFSALLLPDRTYDVTVTPNGEWGARRPPLRVSAQYLSPTGVDDAYLSFLSYPDFCSTATLTLPTAEDDCLVAVEGTVVDALGRGQDGLLVRMVHATTGQVLSSTYSTGSEEETDAGYFRAVVHVQHWRDTTGWLFSLTPTSERLAEVGPGPTFTVDPRSLFETEGRVTILTPEVLSVVRYSGLVESLAGAEALGNATVSFTSSDVADSTTGVVGRFSTTATTVTEGDARGQFEVALLPGTYEVVVTPDSASDLGVLTAQVILPADAPATVGGQLFQVPARAAFGGQVRTADGRGMADAQVRARPRGTEWMEPVAQYARSSTALTDLDGRYALSLDVGVFDFVVEPPDGSNYPWRVVPDQPIGGSDAPLARNFELSAPVTVSGTATFDGVSPVPNGEVRAYAIVESTDTTTRAIAIGRAQTDAEGRFTLLLPPSL